MKKEVWAATCTTSVGNFLAIVRVASRKEALASIRKLFRSLSEDETDWHAKIEQCEKIYLDDTPVTFFDYEIVEAGRVYACALG